MVGMNNTIVLQVAETRFAITCNHLPFIKWMMEQCGGFISRGKPHLRLDLCLDSIQKGRSTRRSLTVTAVRELYQDGALRFNMESSSYADFFWLMLQICLRCAIGAKQPPDILIHSSGVVHGGMAYVFTGKSGSGKSTICKLLAPESSFTILHDEVIAISQTDSNFQAWSTPLLGEMPTRYHRGAPLKAIFFLKQDQDNYPVRLSRRKTAELLCYSLIPPLVVTHGRLTAEQAPSLKQLLALAELVPCYELHFRPEPSFWECIMKLSEEASVTTQRKGEKLWVAVT